MTSFERPRPKSWGGRAQRAHKNGHGGEHTWENHEGGRGCGGSKEGKNSSVLGGSIRSLGCATDQINAGVVVHLTYGSARLQQRRA